MIIALVGMAGAGKTSAANFFFKNGFTVLRFGDQTDIGLKEKGLALTERNESKYREQLREKLGMEAYAIKIEPRIKKALKETKRIVLDGLYSWEEYIYLKKKFSNLVLLAIYSRPSIRYQRLKTRKIRPLVNFNLARKRDFSELVKLNKGGPIALADYLIQNNKTFSTFQRKLTNFLGEYNENFS